jgi:hypothetical protein
MISVSFKETGELITFTQKKRVHDGSDGKERKNYQQ